VRIVSTDGIGVGVTVRVAEKIQALLDDHGVTLGVVKAGDLGQAVVVAYRGEKHSTLVATVEQNPKLIDPDG
jgi:hypothetical protein